MDDTIRLAHAIFSRLGIGQAQDADDQLIYESDTGRLFYDANGSATEARLQVAQLAAHLHMNSADFIVF